MTMTHALHINTFVVIFQIIYIFFFLESHAKHLHTYYHATHYLKNLCRRVVQ